MEKKILIYGFIGGVIALIAAVGFMVYWTNTSFVTEKDWSAYEVLTAADLNSNFDKLDAGLDSLQSLIRAEVGDSAAARFNDPMYLPWTLAYGDSIASNDALTITVQKQTPIGTSGGLFVHNIQGTPQTVRVILDFDLPHFSRLDSLRMKVWTETTNATDYCIMYAYADSLLGLFKANATATSDTLKSGTARTTATKSFVVGGTSGGRQRLITKFLTASDSMFVSEIEAYVTNY